MANRKDIETLKQGAAQVGDEEQVALCERALAGDDAAWCECEEAIREAAAQS